MGVQTFKLGDRRTFRLLSSYPFLVPKSGWVSFSSSYRLLLQETPRFAVPLSLRPRHSRHNNRDVLTRSSPRLPPTLPLNFILAVLPPSSQLDPPTPLNIPAPTLVSPIPPRLVPLQPRRRRLRHPSSWNLRGKLLGTTEPDAFRRRAKRKRRRTRGRLLVPGLRRVGGWQSGWE